MIAYDAPVKYLSLFSGAGGLEGASASPLACCEIDPDCHAVLARRFPRAALHADVRELKPPRADVVAGGWPCQDLSVAGLRRGLAGERSGLFFELLRVAREAGAHTVIAENVPNLLALHGGTAFRLVLEALAADGFAYVAWRVLDARAFGLPHQRRRVFLVASRHYELARALHRPLPGFDQVDAPACAAFYWTAGIQSICYSQGFVPALKVGSSLSIPSPPALVFDGVVRKARADECLRLQGFEPGDFVGVKAAAQYRMAGNAVAVPVGRFAFGSLDGAAAPDGVAGKAGPAGIFAGGEVRRVEHPVPALANTLGALIDRDDRSMLSPRAANGLLTRLARSGKPCPPELRALLLAAGGL
ncbi:MAG: ydiP [Cyanobacteria bacterium RYN_339]|nr:ydiP [Cyanobacteria bacterium RYN_339]